MHAGADRQDILGPGGAVGIAVSLEGKTFQRLLHDLRAARLRQIAQRRRLGHQDQGFLDPASLGDRLGGMADDLAIAPDRLTRGNVLERDLMALRYLLDQPQPAGELRTRLQPAFVGDDRDIVVRPQPDIERLAGLCIVLQPRLLFGFRFRRYRYSGGL